MSKDEHGSIPSELIDQFSRGNGCIFVGAGLSIGAGLPGWADLIMPLMDRISACPPDSSLLDIAQYFENQEGRSSLIRYIQEAVLRKGAKPTEVHRTLVRMPVQRLFTTNFDNLLEVACDEQEIHYDKVVNTEHLPFLDSSRKQVFKVHGELAHPSSIVVTAYDYEKYFHDHPDLADLLKVDLQTRTVLFLGYRFNDFDLRTILSQVSIRTRELRRNLFSIQPNPPPVVVKDLERRGVKVIALEVQAGEDTTQKLHAWLEGLAQRLGESPARRSPAEAAAMVKLTNNNLPRRVEDFLGRKEDFARVLEGLRSRYPLITIEGFAGIGKTSLAIEVGHACLESRGEDESAAVVFDYVAWLSAQEKPEQTRWLNDVLNAIAATTNFQAVTQSPLDEKKRQVDRLLRAYKVLLIVDNFETIDDPELTKWLEQIPEPSKVIITTQRVQLQQKAWPVHLGGLAPGEALMLLRQHAEQLGLKFVKRVSDETLLSLSLVTGGNPQAMKLALGLVEEGQGRLWEVINQLHGSTPASGIDRLFEELFSRSWGMLSENGQKVLLATPLFVGVSSIREDALQAATGLLPFDFRQACDRCIGFSLLEVNPDNDSDIDRLVVHPMTRTFARLRLNERPEWERQGRRGCTDFFLRLIRGSVVREQPAPRYWNALVSEGMNAIDPEWPSIHEVMKWADQESRDELLVELVMLLVHYMDSRFRNSERLEYVRKALAALERMGRKEDEALLRIDALGWTYVEEGSFDVAYHEIHRGFEIAEELSKKRKKEGRDLTALGFAWRARVRLELNEPARAVELIEKALEVRRCSSWICCRVNMAAGDIALKRGDSAKALEYYQAAGRLAESYGGEGRGYQTLPRIGLAYLGVGRLDEAEREFRELQALEQIPIGKLYGEYGLAMVASKRGETQSARELLEKVKAQLSRRTTSNLLWKLIESQEAQLPGLVQELEGLEASRTGIRFPKGPLARQVEALAEPVSRPGRPSPSR